jgi:glycine/D-amino acid oxidase-like deaminating enzyme
MKIAERRVAAWSKLGAPVALLSREEVKRRVGSDAWFGGWWNRSGGHINPLALVRALAGAVVARGGAIYARTPALSYERVGDRWIVTTPHGQLSARALLLATNAYTGAVAPGLAPDIARETIPILSWQMATMPLGDNLRRTILPERSAMSDTHGELYFARYDARHRLVTGGALVNPVNGAERLKPYVAARLRRLFPDIGEVRFDYVWNGTIGMTLDYLPRLHQLGPGGYAWAGCNGRAVGLAIALGAEFARAIQGRPEVELALPFTEPAPVPLHGLVRRVAPLMLLEAKRRDAREV